MNSLHPYHGQVVCRIERPPRSLVETLSKCYTAFIVDRLGKLGVMHREIKPLAQGMKVCGPAVTSLGPDLSVRRMAINLAEAGDVLVVAAGGVSDYACFGDGTASKMRLKGIAGAVIDGSTRDAAGIRALGYPTFARGITPRNYHYPVSAEYGAVNVPVVCGGVQVNPGDVVVGDDDGIVVVPRLLCARLCQDLLSDLDKEGEMRRGMREFVEFDVRTELENRGYVFQ